ncbi:MAG: hypothetical protein IKE91_02910 [Clostridia bacterium]|nr:hypothetical protein [Clostridia bacterium]
MSWNEDHYQFDDDGNFEPGEIDSAIENGDVTTLSNGCLWDRETGAEYWPDGQKK